jgi:probable phosphoglycerate mutase
MRLILVRHGDSDHGKDGRILRPADCPGLTPLGFEQVERLARRFQSSAELSTCDVLLSSPYTRARQTAEGLSAALKRPVVIDDDLQEQRWGEAEGLTVDVYRQRYQAFSAYKEPDRVLAPGGESWNGFRERVYAALERIAAAHKGQTVVACSHGGFIVLSFLAMYWPREGMRPFLDPRHSGLTEWVFDPRQGVWTLARYNDAAHLDTA